MKRLVGFFLTAVGVIALLSSCSPVVEEEDSYGSGLSLRSVYTANTETYTMAPEIYDVVGLGYNNGEKGPVSITEGVLKVSSSSEKVYLVALSGTEFVMNQSTGLITDLLSGFNLNSPYLKRVVSAICNNVPEGSNLMLSGHSLGGMIAQQVAANKEIKQKYNVLYTVTFGSPLLSAGSREGTVKRLGDTADVIPYASGSLINNTIWAIAGLNRESGGYKFASEDAHVKSYARTDVWGAYDVTGTKNGKAVLTVDLDTRKFYQAPVFGN